MLKGNNKKFRKFYDALDFIKKYFPEAIAIPVSAFGIVDSIYTSKSMDYHIADILECSYGYQLTWTEIAFTLKSKIHMEKRLTFDQYQALAPATLKEMATIYGDKVHMDIGILTEVGEILDIFKKKYVYDKDIDFVHLKEEIGDLMWYVSNGHSLMVDLYGNRYSLSEFVKTYQRFKVDNPAINGLITAIVKEMQAKNSDWGLITDYLLTLTCNCVFMVIGANNRIEIATYYALALCEIFKLSTYEIMATNIAKLNLRYKGSFDSYLANHRDLEAERQLLETWNNEEKEY